MSSGPDSSSGVPRRRQPLWPWLLMPLVALTIFLALTKARQMPAPNARTHATAPNGATETAPSDATGTTQR